MAAKAESSTGEARMNGEAAQLAPSLSDVQLVEAFFDVEKRLGIAAAGAAHPAALPQVHARFETYVTAAMTVRMMLRGFVADEHHRMTLHLGNQ